MSSFTCIACNVVFDDGDLQRTHYKTDWHRYNLKRKIAELPAVTEVEFAKKAELQKKKNSQDEKSTTTTCKVCNKSFNTDNAFQNHIKSKKHKEKLSTTTTVGDVKEVKEVSQKNKGTVIEAPPAVVVEEEVVEDDNDEEWEDVSSSEDEEEDTEAIAPTFCLFCPHESVNIENNLKHMSKSHSFFIPDLDYITDVEAMLVYLGAKIGDGKICLLCDAKSKQFQTLQACRKHMIDKGHCMIDYGSDAILEFADFYNYSSSYPDHSDDTDLDSELANLNLGVDSSTMELILPSGARAGHRALKRYYNQSVVPTADQPHKSRMMITNLANHYRSVVGLSGAHLAVATRKKLEAKKVQNRKMLNDRMRLGVKANKFQTYFRKQVMYAG